MTSETHVKKSNKNERQEGKKELRQIERKNRTESNPQDQDLIPTGKKKDWKIPLKQKYLKLPVQ